MNELLKYTYEGSEVTFSNEDNVMVNATQMAKAFGKRPNDWLNLQSTKDFLDELTITRKNGNIEYQAVITKKGGLNPDEGGTWLTEDAALSLQDGYPPLITPRGREVFRLLIPRQQDLDI